MARERLSPEALALIYLRLERGWLQKELAAAMGHSDYRTISRYESGEKALSREVLSAFAARLGHAPEAVDALLSLHSFIAQTPIAERGAPPSLSSEEMRRINRASLSEGWARAEQVRSELIAWKKARKVALDREEAAELWKQLRSLSRPLRRELITDSPEYWSWALAVRLCDDSLRAAADRVEEALELARLALVVARKVEDEASSKRLQAYAWAHIGNALRVGNDFPGADGAFARAWSLWPAAEASDPQLVPPWRMLSLESSLRREQRRFREALSLLDRASALAGGDAVERGKILLNKEFILEEMGDLAAALATLEEAAPFVESSRDLRLLCVHRFEVAKTLCESGRYAEAASRLPQIREMAGRLSNDLDLLRLVWLESRIAAGLGMRKEAIAGLEQVRRDFTARKLPYDASRASLELAVLYLQEEKTREVRALAREMVPVFQAQGIGRESLASLTIFLDAAQKDTATVELARRALAEVAEASRTAFRTKGSGRRA